jgi:hypothetical protein
MASEYPMRTEGTVMDSCFYARGLCRKLCWEVACLARCANRRNYWLVVGVATVMILSAVGGMLSGARGATRYSLISTPAPAPPPPPRTRLAPNDRGYVRVETMSGSAGCSITAELVACQNFAGDWTSSSAGQQYPAASVSADGDFHWVQADLGALEGRVRLGYQTYDAVGWTIAASPAVTTFTNDHNGRGMSVSDQDVQPF